MAIPKKYEHIDFKPPQGVADAAALGLKYRAEFGRGGTEVGVARARDLSNRENTSPDVIGRMVSYFARHAVDAEAEGSEETGFWADPNNPSAGYIAWLLWGGDPGKAWASKVQGQMDAADDEVAKVDVEVGGDALGFGETVAKFCKELSSQGVVFEQGDRVSKEAPGVVAAVATIAAHIDTLGNAVIDLYDAASLYTASKDAALPESALFSAIEKLSSQDAGEHLKPLSKACSGLVNALVGKVEQRQVAKGATPNQSAEIASRALSTLFDRCYTGGEVFPLRKDANGGQDGSERFVLGVVLEPNDGSDGSAVNADTDGDIYSAAEVRKAAHWFMEYGGQHGLLHGPENGGVIFAKGSRKIVLLESYITPIPIPSGSFGEGSVAVKRGAWLMALRINDDDIWQAVRDGDLNGLSIGGIAEEYLLDDEEEVF